MDEPFKIKSNQIPCLHSVAFGGGIFLLRNGPLPSVAVAPRLFASAAACAPKGLRGANPR